METKEYLAARDELATKKHKTEQQLNELAELKNRIKNEEADMQFDTAEDMRELSEMESILDYDGQTKFSGTIDKIRGRVKEYDDYAQEYAKKGFAILNQETEKLEDELIAIRRKASVLEQ